MKRIGILFFGVLICTGLVIGCNNAKDIPIAKISQVKGSVKTMKKAANSLAETKVGQELCNGGAVKVGDESSSTLVFIKDKTQIEIGENTYFEIKNFTEKELKQMGGIAIYKVSPQDKALKVETPHGMATVLGTVFRLDVDEKGTNLSVEKGKVGFNTGKQKMLVVEAGQTYSTTNKDENPVKAIDPFELEKLFSPDSKLKQHFNQR
jgi:ferric-dicitrate binding protein FerR (iron transport regulator)